MVKIAKKFFTVSVVAMTIMWSVGLSALVPMVAVAVDACPELEAGDLFKVPTELGVPETTAVYLLNADVERLWFPNGDVYKSWYSDYSGVEVIPKTCVNNYLQPTVAPYGVNYRPGSFLVKQVITNDVYLIETGNKKTKIGSEEVAAALYGADWNTKKVRDFSDIFWPNFTSEGAEMTTAALHNGMVVTVGGTTNYAMVDGLLYEVDGTPSDVLTVSQALVDAVEMGATTVTAASLKANPAQTTASASEVVPGEEVPAATGTATVSLSANTPAGGSVVKDSDVEFSKFIFKAGATDIKVNAVKIGRSGLGATADFSATAAITLYDGGTKLGSTKSSWNSDNTMTYNVSGGWTIPAGTSKELTVVGNLDVAGTYNALGIVAVTGEGLTTTGLPVYGNQMSAVAVTVGIVTITSVGTDATKKIGTTGVTLAQFKLAVDATENAKVESITFKNKAASPNAADGDIANIYLYKGTTLLAGPVSMVSDKIVFALDEPYPIDKSKNETFKVVGDVINGAANLVEFNLDTVGDLKLRGLTYNTLLTVTDTLATAGMVITIDGAQLNIAYSGTNMDTVDDKTDVVFGTLTLSAGSTDIKISEMIMNVVEVDGNSAVTDNKDVDNFELVDLVGGGAYSGVQTVDADGDTTATAEIWTFSDEIYLSAGETRTFEFRGDLPAGIGSGDSYKVTMTVNTTNLTAETVPAGDSVTNFSIGSFTGKAITVKSPTLKVTGVTMNAGTAVVNDQDVILYKGALEASADDIHVSYADFNNGTGSFAVANWSELGFYLINADGTYDTKQLLSTSGMTSGTVAFDSLDFTVLNGASKKVSFVVKGKVASTVAANLDATLQLDYFTAKDSENNDVVYTPATAGTVSVIGDGTFIATGTRVVTLADTGKLYLQMVNNVTGYNKDRVVLAGTDFWAGKLKVRAADEDIKIKDLKLTNATADDEDNISEVCLYRAELVSAENLIGCSSMDTDDVVFYDDIDEVVEQGTEYWYIYVKTKPMNISALGTAQSRDVIQVSVATSTTGYLAAEGVRSGTAFAVGAHDGTAVAAGTWAFDYDMDDTYNEVADYLGTALTKSFYVAGTRVSNVQLVSSYGGETVATTIEGTGEITVAILAITVEGGANTDANGNALKLAINSFLFDVSKFASTTMNNAPTIKRIGGGTTASTLTTTANSTDGIGALAVGGDWTLTAVTSTLGLDAFVEPGTTAYFVVKASIDSLSTGTNLTNWIKIGLDDLKGTSSTLNNIDWFDGYDTGYDGANDFDYLYLDTESIAGTKISAAKNN